MANAEPLTLPEFVATLERCLAEEPQLALKHKAKVQQLLECVCLDSIHTRRVWLLRRY